jgi:hypothetical protein
MAQYTPDLALDGGEGSASHLGRFIPQGGGAAGRFGDEKNLLPYWESNPGFSNIWPDHYAVTAYLVS